MAKTKSKDDLKKVIDSYYQRSQESLRRFNKDLEDIKKSKPENELTIRDLDLISARSSISQIDYALRYARDGCIIGGQEVEGCIIDEVIKMTQESLKLIKYLTGIVYKIVPECNPESDDYRMTDFPYTTSEEPDIKKNLACFIKHGENDFAYTYAKEKKIPLYKIDELIQKGPLKELIKKVTERVNGGYGHNFKHISNILSSDDTKAISYNLENTITGQHCEYLKGIGASNENEDIVVIQMQPTRGIRGSSYNLKAFQKLEDDIYKLHLENECGNTSYKIDFKKKTSESLI